MPSDSKYFVAPSSYRNLRACMICSFVQPQSRFNKEGCPNCDEIVALKGNPELVEDVTSPVFEGLIALREPVTSWVARWQRIDGFVKGMYAVKVSGKLPEEVVQELAENNKTYIARDGSYQVEDWRSSARLR